MEIETKTNLKDDELIILDRIIDDTKIIMIELDSIIQKLNDWNMERA